MKRLILVGGGHAHLAVLAALAAAPANDMDVVLVSPSPYQWYSGMLPGWISGHYRQAQCRIDLGALASAARTAFRQERVEAIDAANQCLTLSGGGRLFYDYLSIDTGSEIDGAWSGARRDMVLPIKPLDTFFERWPTVIAAARRTPGFRIVVVGGGAAGVETAMAVAHALGDAAPGASVALVSASAGVLAGHSPSVRRRVVKSLAAAGIDIHAQLASGHAQGVELADGSLLRADCVITATGARAPGFLKRSGLELDPAGYIAVNPHHQSCSHANVFAAGDVCARKDVVMARSGTHAVHAGPVLAHNLFAAVRGEPLRQYRPRRHSLYLIACGTRYAIASWGSLGAQGAWIWTVKDWIDRRFVARYSVPAYGSPAIADAS